MRLFQASLLALAALGAACLPPPLEWDPPDAGDDGPSPGADVASMPDGLDPSDRSSVAPDTGSNPPVETGVALEASADRSAEASTDVAGDATRDIRDASFDVRDAFLDLSRQDAFEAAPPEAGKDSAPPDVVCVPDCRERICGASDGCGGRCSQGMCTPPDTCGGAGMDNVCGCTPNCPVGMCDNPDGCGKICGCPLNLVCVLGKCLVN